MKRHVLDSGIAILGLALLFGTTGCHPEEGGRTAGEWPGRKTIHIAVFASPGGSTDLANRAMAGAIERELGATFSVLNMSGAQGGVAAAHVWNARRDGHTWFGMSEGSLAMPVLGVHSTTSRDWNYFVICGTPGILSVPADSPYSNIEELIAAIRARPNQVRMASSFPGTVWHVQYLVMARAGGLQIRWISYPGSHPSQVAALSGEVDAVLTGLGEQVELLRSGHLRPLAVMETEAHRFEGIGAMPPITEAVPELHDHLPLRQYIGFALPADTPAEILEKIEAAFERAMNSDEIRQFARASYSELFGYSGEEAAVLFAERERVLTWLLYEEQIARHSPEKFGIGRP
jgi:tripartite-type tricarboxylate transporter receptor subunit TctC